MTTLSLSALTTGSGFIRDGDWIESKDQDPSGGIRLVQLQDIGDGQFRNKSRKFINEDTAIRLNCTRLQEGDVLIARMPDPLGRACVFPGVGQPAITAVDICIVRPNPTIVDADWLVFFINSEIVRRSIQEYAQGATRARVPTGKLRQLEISLPSLTRQRDIAAHLKTQLAVVEAARRAAQVQWRNVATLKKKALEAIFNGIANRAPIGSAAKLQSGYAFKSDNFKPTGVRLLRNANIIPGKIYWDDTVFLGEQDSNTYPGYTLFDGDVLISLDRPLISSGIKVARVSADDLPALLVQRVGRFLIDASKLDADYLYAYLQTDFFISKISGHDQSLGVPHISPSQVEDIVLPLPEISVQRSIAKRLNEVSAVWRAAALALQSQLEDLSILSDKILAQAFEIQRNG